MIEIAPRTQTRPWVQALIPVIAALGALALAAIPLAAAGAPVLQAYGTMFMGVFGSVFTITETLTRATPLIRPVISLPTRSNR